MLARAALLKFIPGPSLDLDLSRGADVLPNYKSFASLLPDLPLALTPASSLSPRVAELPLPNYGFRPLVAEPSLLVALPPPSSLDSPGLIEFLPDVSLEDVDTLLKVDLVVVGVSPSFLPLNLLDVVPTLEGVFLDAAPALAVPPPNLDAATLEVLPPSASFFSFSAIFSLSIFYFSTSVCLLSTVPVGLASPEGFLIPPILDVGSATLVGPCIPLVFGLFGDKPSFSASWMALVSFLFF